jgi:predicted nucleic acid-binding protein
MALIISDTTTPMILAKTNHLNLLSNFVEIVYIPPAVKEELSQKNDGVKEAIEKADFIKIREVSNQRILDDIQSANLDRGEIEAISLALETGLDLIIDERLGRRYAQSKNINIMGLLGILKINLVNGFISYVELLYILEEFKEVGFRINPRLEKSFLDSIIGLKK